jgi:nuclear GTP-binding protein
MAKEQHGVRANGKRLHSKFNKGSKSNAATNPDRVIKGNTNGVGNTFRTKNTIKRLKMYDQKMPDKKKMYERPTEQVRVDPNRKWFGNVRTIDQKAL